MSCPPTTALLECWEQGLAASPTRRALLLLHAAQPQLDPGTLRQASIGHRDAWLLSLRECLFGSSLSCVGACPHCGERLELDFRTQDVRAPYAPAGQVCEWPAAPADGARSRRFRPPCSADLLAIETERDADAAAARLLALCRIPGEDADPTAPDPALNPAQMTAVAQALSAADPQAEVLLDTTCPACGAPAQLLFDIASHLWSELDRWARGLLHKIHLLASRYGWSEAQILALSPARRQAYLQCIGAA